VKAYLLVDFGSTYTKLTCVDLDDEYIIGTAKAPTTVLTNVLDGYEKALSYLISDHPEITEIEGISACSSAAGGLKMAAIGLIEELTVEAAKRACLGAGALVTKVYSHHMTNDEAKELVDSDIDIVLLAGGTDGGNKECIIHNAKKIAQVKLKVPIIVAGNKDARDEIKSIFDEANIEYVIVKNVMPKLKKLDVAEAKHAIRSIFIDKIIEAKGIKKAQERIKDIIMPTPEAVLKAAELLSNGYEDEEGYGELIVIDIGGATTDVHSVGKGNPKRTEVIMKGLEEPFAKRTVEGDLGMRYSANALLSLVSDYEFKHYFDENDTCNHNIETSLKRRTKKVEFIPRTKDEDEFDKAIAKICADVSMSRHVGQIEVVHTPLGDMFYQTGKDLSGVKYVIGTGGVLINHKDAKQILKHVTKKSARTLELRPENPSILIDRSYIMAAMGLLSQSYPKTALKLLKQYLL
jgi:uncharacterized protein (TIGR01319 family)